MGGGYRYTGQDTLDEPVGTTIVREPLSEQRPSLIRVQARDALSIYNKLVHVLYPRKSTGREVLKCVTMHIAAHLYTEPLIQRLGPVGSTHPLPRAWHHAQHKRTSSDVRPYAPSLIVLPRLLQTSPSASLLASSSSAPSAPWS